MGRKAKKSIFISYLSEEDSDLRKALTMVNEQLRTVAEAAQLRETSVSSIHELLTRHRLNSVDIRGRKFVFIEELENFIHKRVGRKPALTKGKREKRQENGGDGKLSSR